jgi:peptidyl-prolyl cis-trans isomerase C
MSHASRRTLLPLLAVAVAVAAIGCAGSSGTAPAADAVAGSKPSTSTRTSRPGWKPAQPDTSGPVVAVFGAKRITRHDVDSVIATAPADMQPRLRSEDGYRQLVERMVIEEAMLELAEGNRIELDPAYRSEVEKASRAAKMRVYYNRRLEALPAVTDSAVEAHYQANLDRYRIPARVRVRHIQSATQAASKAVRRRLLKGEPWDATCQSVSEDKLSKDRGGLLGYVSKAVDVVPGVGAAPAIVASAFELKEGEISQPLKGPKGWHLIMADNKEEATVQSYESVKKEIRVELEGAASDAFGQALTDSLRGVANAAISDDSIRVAIMPARTPADFFKEAQAAMVPLDRIALYRRLIQRFPQDSVTVQARFMIGFTYAEDLGDYEKAKVAFEEFLQHHPNTELSNSARWMLENMEKAPPELNEEEDAAPKGGSSGSKSESSDGGGTPPDRAPRRP